MNYPLSYNEYYTLKHYKIKTKINTINIPPCHIPCPAPSTVECLHPIEECPIKDIMAKPVKVHRLSHDDIMACNPPLIKEC